MNRRGTANSEAYEVRGRRRETERGGERQRETGRERYPKSKRASDRERKTERERAIEIETLIIWSDLDTYRVLE